MAGAEESVGASDGEAHRVLKAVGDALRDSLAAVGAIEPGVRREEEGAVGRIDPEVLDVDGPRIAAREGLLLAAVRAEQHTGHHDGAGDDEGAQQ